MEQEAERLSELLSEAIASKLQQHRQEEQQQVDALLASQKHLTSNLRTLINSLDTILQLSTPRYSSSQGDLVSSCVNRSRTLATRLEQVAARLARIQDHLTQQEAQHGLRKPAEQPAATRDAAQAMAAEAAAVTAGEAETAAAGGTPPAEAPLQPGSSQQQQQQQSGTPEEQAAAG